MLITTYFSLPSLLQIKLFFMSSNETILTTQALLASRGNRDVPELED